MGVHYQPNRTVKEIYVTGELQSKDDKDNFFNLLKDNNVSGFRITFFDASTLPLEVIEKLIDAKTEKSPENVEVIVMQYCLYRYLLRLSVRSRCLRNRTTSGYHGCLDEDAESEVLDENSARSLLQDIYDTYGYDYSDYEVSSALRRIKKAMINEGVKSLSLFRSMVLSDRRVFNGLFDELSITTTEFFRDPHVYNFLKTKVLPYLNTYPHLKIWSAGCSTGQEPYSLAIMLDELGMLHKSHIYATDLNPYAIEEAKNGIYSSECMEECQGNYAKSGGAKGLENYFENTEQYLKIKDRYKKNILFFQHSLVNSGILNEFQLILCRNVMIYFNNDLQEKVLRLFYNSLEISGFLVLGKGEGMLNNNGDRYFKVYDSSCKVFKRLPV